MGNSYFFPQVLIYPETVHPQKWKLAVYFLPFVTPLSTLLLSLAAVSLGAITELYPAQGKFELIKTT